MIPQRLLYKRIASLVSVVSVASLFLQWFVPMQAEGDGDSYVYVTRQNTSGDTLLGSCGLLATFPPDSSLADRPCSLNQAIAFVNTLNSSEVTQTVHIRINPALTALAFIQNTPAITFGGTLNIDGQRDSNTKTILRDGTADQSILDYFFLVNVPEPVSGIPRLTIQNFAFTSLHKSTAHAITTDKNLSIPDSTGVRSSIEGTYAVSLSILNNYFGTVDGNTVTADNSITGSIQMNIFRVGSVTPQVTIQGNNIFNSSRGVFVGMGESETNKSCVFTYGTGFIIQNNTIGVATNGTAPEASSPNPGSWFGTGIEVCGAAGVNISGNTIANSSKIITTLNTAIKLVRSSGKIQNNLIGTSSASTGLSNSAARIYGNGIEIFGKSVSERKTFITDNRIHNLVRLFPSTCTNPLSRYYPVATTTSVCGGTGILIEGGSYNWIYNNRIGSKKLSNQGYGISIEGQLISDQDPEESFPDPALRNFNTSHHNVIRGNSISYNGADGIHINTITDLDPANITQGECDYTFSSQHHYSNNCYNSIVGNEIFRNGTSNAVDHGGIGIDLKGVGESEQNTTSSSPEVVSTGTNNDSDITTITGLGANALISPPSIYGDGTSSLQASTASEIKGFLAANYPQGRYWIEVYTVLCPSGTSDDFTSLSRECDTDSPTEQLQTSNQTYGQGSAFVCGTLVNKSAGAPLDWSCRPSDFGRPNVSGLVSAVVTQAPQITMPYLYHTDGSHPDDPTVPTANFGVPTARYSCALIASVFQGETPCTGTLVSAELNTFGTMAVAATFGNSSEFSRNAYISTPEVSFKVSKTVAICSSESSCDGVYTDTPPPAQSGDHVDYRILVTNMSTDTPLSIQLSDSVPAGLSKVLDCIYENNITEGSPTRDHLTTSSLICDIEASPISVSLNNIAPGERAVLFVRARISPDFQGDLSNIATALEPQSGVAKTSKVEIPVVIPASGTTTTLSKVILGADTDYSLAESSFEIASSTTAHLVHYQITATADGYNAATVANLTLEDNFPRAPGVSYEDCTYLLTVNSTPYPGNCISDTDMNAANDQSIEIFTGQTILSAHPSLTITDRIELRVLYNVRIAANTVATSAPLNNVATWGERGASGDVRNFSSTSLTITDAVIVPDGPGSSPSLSTQIRNCAGTDAASCSDNTFVTSLSDVEAGSTVEYRLEVSPSNSSADTTITIQNVQPAGITFVPTSCVYTGSNLPTSALSNTGARIGNTPCTFSGTTIRITTTIGAGRYAYVYVLARVNSTSSGTIDNTAQLTNGCVQSERRCDAVASLTVASSAPVTTTLTKIVSAPSGVTLGSSNQAVTYTVKLTKPAGTAFTNISWNDTFPNSVAGSSPRIIYTNCQSSVSTLVCSPSFGVGNNFITSGGSIAADVTGVTITYTATIQGGALTSNQTITNTTTFTSAQATRSASVDLVVRPAAASGTTTGMGQPLFTKRADNNVTSALRANEKIYKPGDIVNYTISLSNTGSAPAAAITLVDTLPENLSSPVINTVSGLIATIANRVITSSPFTLAVGANSASITYRTSIASARDYDLSSVDLNTRASATDDDFFIDENADIESDVASRSNSHRRDDAVIGSPDGIALSLGDGGSVIIDLGDKLIVNGSGNDFGVVAATRLAGDTDSATSTYQVSVSQDGSDFTDIGDDDNSETTYFDLRRVSLPWIRFIQITDTSRVVSGTAPGAAIDAVCLFNIGVEEINQATLTYNGAVIRSAAPIVVDVTSTFRHEPDPDNCVEQEVAFVSDYIPPVLSPPGSVVQQPREQSPLVNPPGVPGSHNTATTPTHPRAPALPKTGSEVTAFIAIVSSLTWWRLRKKK